MRRAARRQRILHIVSTPETDASNRVAAAVDEHPENSLGRSQLRSLLERHLDDLPEDFRMVFVLRSVEELSVEETAQALSIPNATVRSRYFRAKSLLREALAQELDFAERDMFDFAGARCDRVVTAVLSRLPGPAT
jgi:RNA polymerase sigma-70 factor (ECF subfamily)